MSGLFYREGLGLASLLLLLAIIIPPFVVGGWATRRTGKEGAGWAAGLATLALLAALLYPVREIIVAEQCTLDPLSEACD